MCCHLHMESKKQNKQQTRQKLLHRRREQAAGGQRGGRLGRWVDKAEGLGGAGCQLQNSHGEMQYSTGNTVTNILTATYAVRWVVNSLR